MSQGDGHLRPMCDKHLGELLRHLRERCGLDGAAAPFPSRPESSPPRESPDARRAAPREVRYVVPRDVAALLAYFEAQGYVIRAKTYREIEAGARIPPDPARFVGLVAVYFDLTDEGRRALLRQVAHDILLAELGPRYTALVAGQLGLGDL